MEFTFEEMLEKLKTWPEIDLMELLDISSEEIVERFVDLIEKRQEQIREFISNEIEDLLPDGSEEN